MIPVTWRHGSKRALKRIGLLPAARALQRQLLSLLSPTVRRREEALRQKFHGFAREYGEVLRLPLSSGRHPPKRALVVSIGFPDGVAVELGLIKGLELAGFSPVVLTSGDPWLARYYGLLNSVEVLSWEEFAAPIGSADAEALVADMNSFDDLLAFEYGGARVGRFAASTLFRDLRVGSLDLQSPRIRQALAEQIARGMTSAVAAREIVGKVSPDMALFVDRGYTPWGELFDICLAEGVDTITWNSAHKSSTLMLKRYSSNNRDEHPASLADETWRWVRNMKWTEAHRQSLRRELHDTYASGDWYSEVGTQFNKRILEPDKVRAQLGLDPNRKTAVIFPHILWDGTFFWGKDLFRTYEEWFVETVRAACANDRLNWIIKIHPANTIKNARHGIQGEPSELIALRRYMGQLPPHLFIIPPESDINTFSLFDLMDCCVTVRGTVGMEAASFGVPVLTAGTGRYDRKGFTIDPESRQQYLERLAGIHEIPPLSPQQLVLAERFAYSVFVLRPLRLTTVTMEYRQDARATSETRINAATREDWLNAPDLTTFARWLQEREKVDFLTADGEGHPQAHAPLRNTSG